MKKSSAKLPEELYTDTFLKMAKYYAGRFIAEQGYGKWLAEYQAMLDAGQFKPERLRSAYICLKQGKAENLGFIKFDAINRICILALDATRSALNSDKYAIQVITGEIAMDDNGIELTGLTFTEAVALCKEMNEEAEEELFKITRI